MAFSAGPFAAGPFGLAFAPCTRTVLAASAGLSLLLPIVSVKTVFGLRLASIMQGQVLRILAGTIVFETPGELLFGSILIYYFRVLERQMGIAKFATYVFVSFVLATLLQIGVLVAFPATIGQFASGPYGFIFSSMTLVFLRIPRLHNLSVFGLPVTDKFFAYLFAIQMAFSNSPSSVVSAGIGILTGCIYHFDVIGFQRMIPPKWLRDAVARIVIPNHEAVSISQAALQNSPESATAQNAQAETLLGPGAGMGFGGGMGMGGMAGMTGLGGLAAQRAPATALVQANPDLVRSLVSVTGMPQQQVEQALVSTNNNPDAATAQLLRLD